MSCRLNSFWAGAAWYLRGDRTVAVSMAANRSWAAAPESSHPAASSLATAAADMVAGEEQGIGYCKRPISANGVLEAAISARRLFVVNILKSRRLVASKEEKRAHDNSRAEEIDSPSATHPSCPEPEVLAASRVSSFTLPPPMQTKMCVCATVQPERAAVPIEGVRTGAGAFHPPFRIVS